MTTITTERAHRAEHGSPDKLRTAIDQAVQDPEYRASVAARGVQNFYVPPGEIESFVKNDKQTVEQMLKEKNTVVAGFTMFVVGEGIEKKVDDFAAEVAAQVAAASQA